MSMNDISFIIFLPLVKCYLAFLPQTPGMMCLWMTFWAILAVVRLYPSTNINTYGSGVYIGLDEWRMYWVEWNTLKAKPAKKSREDNSPATGRKRNPVQPWSTKTLYVTIWGEFWSINTCLWLIVYCFSHRIIFVEWWQWHLCVFTYFSGSLRLLPAGEYCLLDSHSISPEEETHGCVHSKHG